MPEPIKNLSFPKLKVQSNRTIQIHEKSANSHVYAHPLFDEGVHQFGYYERVEMLTHKNFVPGSYHQIFYILNGSINYLCGRKNFIANSGQMMLLPSGFSYKRVSFTKGTTYLYFRVKPITNWTSLTKVGPYVRNFDDLDILYSIVIKILNQTKQESSALRRECLEYSRMTLSILQLEKIYSIKERPEEVGLDRLTRKVKRNLKYKWTIKEMSHILSVSPSTLNRLCRKYHHHSAIDLVIKLRIEHSVQLLINNKNNIKSIANAVGYSSVSIFSKLFLKHMGIRPGAFRKSHR
jgi:AraC-like DNA-binding protein